MAWRLHSMLPAARRSGGEHEMTKRISMVLAVSAILFATQAAHASTGAAVYTDQARGIYGAPTASAVPGRMIVGNEHSAAMARGLTHDQAREATTIARAAPHGAPNLHSEAMARGLTHDQAVASTTGLGAPLSR